MISRRKFVQSSILVGTGSFFYSNSRLEASIQSTDEIFPDGWTTASPRKEIEPVFSYDPKGGPGNNGSFIIESDSRDGLVGRWTKKIPVKGGQYYRFSVRRKFSGLVERDGSLIYNVAVLIGPDGNVIGKYRRVCLPNPEIDGGITPGKDYPVFDTRFGKVGMMICYDGYFPKVASELCLRGAEVIAWTVMGCNPLLARARATENHVYIISSTHTPSEKNWMISAVFDHEGNVIANAKEYVQLQ